MKIVLENLNLKPDSMGTSSGLNWYGGSSSKIRSYSPVDGEMIGEVSVTSKDDYIKTINAAKLAFKEWQLVPAPKRGEIVRQFGEVLRENKEDLGKLVSYEMGKSYQEGLGEVQEMIDICDYAVGLSRQLSGITLHSERTEHRMYEQYHPLGVVGIISAFNFPVAVWAWNAAIAWVCGNVCVWKPSEKTPFCALACQNIMRTVLKNNNLPEGICCLVNGDSGVGEMMTNDTNVSLISATGSTRMGRIVGAKVAERFGKTILELGGNNAVIITPDADLNIATIGVVFGAVGTAGQRCTTTRRLIVHESVYEAVKERLISAYKQLTIGDPLDEKNHMGPLIDVDAVKAYQKAIESIQKEGGRVIVDGGVLSGEGYRSGCYVRPVVIEAENHFKTVQTETFAPILYLMKYQNIEEAIGLQNSVPQGLSSAIITNNLREAEKFLSHAGSDCGIANVNIGTSGAEIGGAFGGEKETGGGRESGSDSWKAYMRRQTNTINYSCELPLAQGIKFDF
jgi:aldehyde dehydrogenase (NAD+)